ncbi:MFS transporter [Streptomyces griseoflavus]|uniref:MFS transporter n=1 Tax=Streptomyces griseoflavus TaxID=35619 RepID=UPI000300C64B|nr:MFS transporter [Streptomyces griseoflavus]
MAAKAVRSEAPVPIGLFALALAGFGIGIAEFVIVGLLPEIATQYAVSEAAAGILVSGYAIAVAVGAIALTAAVSRFNRKHVLLGLMALFIVGNLICAVAPTYEIMLIGRVIAALSHGAFYGVATVVAASLVDEQKKARAISFMFAGLTVAMVLGVPAGTFLGQVAGWRSTFWAITLIGAISTVGIALLVRPVTTTTATATGQRPARLRDEFRIFGRGRVLASALRTSKPSARSRSRAASM